MPASAQPALTRQQAAARYLTIARAGNQRLETDFDQLEGPDHARLGAADADLADAATTERLFDTGLAVIDFDRAIEPIALLLYRINQSRASLTAAASRSASLPQLRSWERRLDQANGQVEQAVRVIRNQLGLPPPDTS